MLALLALLALLARRRHRKLAEDAGKSQQPPDTASGIFLGTAISRSDYNSPYPTGVLGVYINPSFEVSLGGTGPGGLPSLPPGGLRKTIEPCRGV